MRTKSTLFRIAALAFVAALSLPAAAQQADFTMFAQIGDSLSSGFSNGCLVDYTQNDSFGAIIARHAGVSGFQQPLIGSPGLGPCMYLTSLAPTFGYWPNTGVPTNLALARPYNNLGVPGFTVSNVVDTNPTTAAGGLTYIILRGLGTSLQQAAALKPTFLTIFIGNNDVLNAAGLATVIDGVTLTPISVFDSKFQTIVDTMKAAQGGTGKGLVLNIGDVSALPFFSTVSPILGTNPATGAPIYALSDYACPTGVPGLPGPGRLAPDPESGASSSRRAYGIPCAILSAERSKAGELQQAASEQLRPVGRRRDLPGQAGRRPDAGRDHPAPRADGGVQRLDRGEGDRRRATSCTTWRRFFQDIRAHGRTYGGLTVTTAYLQGGFFGYDGVHPTSLGYAIFAARADRLHQRELREQPRQRRHDRLSRQREHLGGRIPVRAHPDAASRRVHERRADRMGRSRLQPRKLGKFAKVHLHAARPPRRRAG